MHYCTSCVLYIVPPCCFVVLCAPFTLVQRTFELSLLQLSDLRFLFYKSTSQGGPLRPPPAPGGLAPFLGLVPLFSKILYKNVILFVTYDPRLLAARWKRLPRFRALSLLIFKLPRGLGGGRRRLIRTTVRNLQPIMHILQINGRISVCWAPSLSFSRPPREIWENRVSPGDYLFVRGLLRFAKRPLSLVFDELAPPRWLP